MLIAIKHYVQYLCIRSENLYSAHRRRLVINMGEAKIWITNIGWGKNFGEIYFQTKNLEKVPFYSPKNY